MVRSQLWLNKSTQLFILCHFQLASLKLQLFVVVFFFFFLMLCYVIIFLHFAVSFHPAHELTQSFSQPTPLEGCPCPHPQGHASQLLLFPLTALTLLIFLFSPMYFFFFVVVVLEFNAFVYLQFKTISNSRSLFTVDPSFLCGCKQQCLGSSYYCYWVNFLVLCTWIGNSLFFLPPKASVHPIYAGGMSEAGRIMCQCKYLSLP